MYFLRSWSLGNTVCILGKLTSVNLESRRLPKICGFPLTWAEKVERISTQSAPFHFLSLLFLNCGSSWDFEAKWWGVRGDTVPSKYMVFEVIMA